MSSPISQDRKCELADRDTSPVRLAPDMLHPWIGALEAYKSEMSEWMERVERKLDRLAEQLACLEENVELIEGALDEAGKSLRSIII
jgi:response regulator RpfG family c-di-GMP phosphodiesterase